jgi:predicted dinucleotide-binding enzyme
MTATGLTTIGFIGAGNIGGQLARLAVAHGYRVVVSNSRGPETLADLVAELGPQATAATAAEAAAAGDLVVVTVPLKSYRDVPVEPLAGKVVVDTNNYYFERDGHIAELDEERMTVSQLLQDHLPTSRVVKGFNNIMAADLTTNGAPPGTADRRALPIAGDDADAKKLVATLFDEFGFTAVDAGTLADSWRFERDRPAYVVRMNADEVPAKLAEATRGA